MWRIDCSIWWSYRDPEYTPTVLVNAEHVLPFFTTPNEEYAFWLVKEHCGISRELASKRLHAIKGAARLGGADNVFFDRSGGVYHPWTLEYIGSLTLGGARRKVS